MAQAGFESFLYLPLAEVMLLRADDGRYVNYIDPAAL